MAYEQLWTKNFEADFGDLPATLPGLVFPLMLIVLTFVFL